MRFPCQRKAAFTLLELVIVLGIIAIMFGIGVPAFVQARQKKPLQQGAGDVLEGLKQARATAILTGSPADLVIHMEDRTLSVVKVAGAAQEVPAEINTRMANAAPKGFTGQIPGVLKIEMLAVNFQDATVLEDVHVRFQPNGISDEFTIILHSQDDEYRKISLEVITGLAMVETDPKNFLKK